MNIPLTLTQGDLLQEALAVTFAKDQTQALNIPVKVPLGGGRYAELTEWNGSKSGYEILENRYDSYQSRCQLIITTVESLVQCYASGGRFDQLSERPVDWRYDLGEDVYVIIKAPQLRIHIRKYFVPNGEWTLHPTKRGVTLSLYEWKELTKNIPLFEAV